MLSPWLSTFFYNSGIQEMSNKRVKWKPVIQVKLGNIYLSKKARTEEGKKGVSKEKRKEGRDVYAHAW